MPGVFVFSGWQVWFSACGHSCSVLPDIAPAPESPEVGIGGINADNVERALTDIRPYGIDLCSGVEAAKGKKDPEKLRALVSNFNAARAKMEEN